MSFSNQSSRIFGLITRIKFFKPLQILINKAYIKYFKIDMSEFKQARDYESLNALFTRSLEISRKLEDDFIAPCDGKIIQITNSFCQKKDEFLSFSIKGKVYSINALIRDNFELKELENGLDCVNIYLSPKDYHRYHAPCNLEILSAIYTRGKLYSVNEKYLKRIPNLYSENERVCLKCKSENNFIFWLIFVGAQNVGKMRFNFDFNIQTNTNKYDNFTTTYHNLKITKGEELGNFELGSTIVIIAQKGFLNFKIQENQNIKFGQNIANFIN
ncbi:phosphatidylserine decarboxylase [Campylobacter sp. 2018MI35]|uniref:phosphatidylserine decarboxylase n=1 Tax=Campylobacter sp. 2018MI34 TaxID=2800582 RepID=UPI0019080EEB|nr:phosphatidylserine decarboxylase [Campylobacter sp. 2018MI34]MBK1991295.1 phosphatidylserine decarboxylase [Campylobacter sp. 2018MI34]